VNVANAGDGANRPLGADDDPALIHQRLVKPAPEHLHGQQAMRRDAANHATQFVHVGVHHDARTFGTLRGDEGAEAIVPDPAGVRFDGIHHQLADGFFKSGRTGGIGQLAQ